MTNTTDNGCAPRPECPTGYGLLQDPVLNKGTSFTHEERRHLMIEGLLPPGYNTMTDQVVRTMLNFRRLKTDLGKYSFMMGLMERDLTLFNRVVLDHLEEIMPIIYTPTVGRASQEYSHIFMKPQGLFLSPRYSGRFREVLDNWPMDDVRVVVVTDGERILGLGDLGMSGMAIPVGKLILYVACGGFHPHWCLPMSIDVGTNNASLLNDPLYLGLRHERIRGEAYDAIIDELVEAVNDRFPGVLLHFEDFANQNAFRFLERYRNQICTFNDDIQGTAGVALAGLYAATRMISQKLSDQTLLFLGAGGAGIGIGELVVSAMVAEGLDEKTARKRCWFVDSKGLIVRSRDALSPLKKRFAHEGGYVPDFLSAVNQVKPTAIIGVSGQTGAFSSEVLAAMAGINERPIVFALSNPTTKSECTAEEAYTWTQGRAVFASGSPFEPVSYQKQTFLPGQGNNAYIFPGVGLGVVASRANRVTDEMFLAAAQTLSQQVTHADFEKGRIYPSLASIRDVSAAIAASVADVAFRRELAGIAPPDNIDAFIRSHMYLPEYRSYGGAE